MARPADFTWKGLTAAQWGRKYERLMKKAIGLQQIIEGDEKYIEQKNQRTMNKTTKAEESTPKKAAKPRKKAKSKK